MFKDFYYKKYLKYKNKYINLQSQLGGRTNPVSLNDLPDAISSENNYVASVSIASCHAVGDPASGDPASGDPVSRYSHIEVVL